MLINQQVHKEVSTLLPVIDSIQVSILQQKNALEEVSKSISEINSTIQINTANAEELASSSESLSKMASDI
jgi:methyl-accepting chemotaxis protein